VRLPAATPIPASPRRGFTLVELTVVIVIIAILAGIGFGAIVANRNQNQGKIAANLVADVIRQARHTALSSGAPVELHLHEDAGRWVIDGATQMPLWSEQFEGNDSTTRVDPIAGDHPGFAGQGRLVTSGGTAIELDAAKGLLRDPDDSLFLECAVYAKPMASPADIFALAVKDAAGNVLAIDLVPTHPGDPERSRWRPAGHVFDEDAGDMVGATDDRVTVATGDWLRIGLLYSRGEFELFAGNEEVATGTATLPDDLAGPFTVQIGDSGTAPGVVDNCRLYRLGASSRIPFPPQLTPEDEYRLRVLPDGSVEGDTTIVVAGAAGERNRAVITVTAFGKVDLALENQP